MTEDIRQRARRLAKGHSFEEFSIGQVFEHHWGRTINEGDNSTEMAVGVTGAGIQIDGGNGYTTERAVERYWRDARLTTIFEGTSQIQQRIISDRLLPCSPLT